MIYPSKQKFKQLATKGNLVPVVRKLFADFETPLSAYLKIRGQSNSFLLESVEGGEHVGRYSFLGTNPRAVIQQWDNRVQVWVGKEKVQELIVDPKGKEPGSVSDGLRVVEQYLSRFKQVEYPGLPRFTGGALGYVGYEFIHDIIPVVPRPPKDELRTPIIYFLIVDELIAFDRVDQSMIILVNAYVDRPEEVEKAYERAVYRLEQITELLGRSIRVRVTDLPDDLPELPVRSNMSREQFLQNVSKAKEYIAAGDAIQIVGSQRFEVTCPAHPLDVYRAIRTINPSPYLFLLELDGFSLVGSSPEIHVRYENGLAEIRPIAGTRPRGVDNEQDRRFEEELKADPKERAEHVMLVDLARNDLGRVCEAGSVRVKELAIVERYSHVMHLVSHVIGRLDRRYSPYDLLRATFPAGTLTGAPKVRAMQIISELEGTCRGPYGGCVGYFAFNGNLDSCITIRTALLKEGKAFVQAGGGWVADSVPESEYMETVNKAKAVLKAVAMALAINRMEKLLPDEAMLIPFQNLTF